jgi:hypothetical protein
MKANSLSELVFKLNTYTKVYSKKSKSIDIDDFRHKETIWQTTIARDPLFK